MTERIRVVGVGFDHMHIGDQLATALAHPDAEIVGAWDGDGADGDGADGARARAVLADLGIGLDVDDDLEALLARTRPDLAFVCSTTAEHPALVRRLAAAGVHMIVEKPFADSPEAAAAMLAAVAGRDLVLATNWPLAWVPAHRTMRRLIAQGRIGRVTEVQFHDGNRGPLFHSHGKIALSPSVEDKAASWWYRPEAGGGSMRDYLGYGTTLGTWLRDGETPFAITAAWHIPEGLEVDEQSVVIGHYAEGLSVFQTRWGTFSDPWTLQPQPHCGFVVNGTGGSVSSWDYADHVTVHDADGVERVPADVPEPEDATALANVIAHLRHGRPLDAPLTAETTVAGHRMVEAAVESARTGRRVALDEVMAGEGGSR